MSANAFMYLYSLKVNNPSIIVYQECGEQELVYNFNQINKMRLKNRAFMNNKIKQIASSFLIPIYC